MKKFHLVLCGMLSLIPPVFLSSCLTNSAIFGNTYAAMQDSRDTDASKYYDYKIKNFKFPDGKVADVYIFNTVKDQHGWFFAQREAIDPSYQKQQKENIAKYTAWLKESEFESIRARYKEWIAEARWTAKVKGPLTPFYKVYFALEEQYGKEKLIEMAKAQYAMPIISYYELSDLGELADYMTENSAASACFEDSTGVYMLTICPPKNLAALRKNTKEKKRHNGQMGYEVAYIPRSAYPKITPPKLTPAKVTPLDPSSLPDSDLSLNPVSPSEKSPYYYDANLANQLQWLAVKIACKGRYDMAYTGNFRAKNPHDYYTTSFIKSYLAANDGRASKGTTLFEGICFDYADFAYQELSDNRKNYSSRIKSFAMVGTFSNSQDIIAYRIAENGEAYDMTINRTPVVVYSHNRIRAHGGATNHAWFWVLATDGTMYWVDPTWTDNSGRPVYGIVRGGQEVQLEADSRYCAH